MTQVAETVRVERLIEERDGLQVRINGLNEFLTTPVGVSPEQITLLHIQLGIMNVYLNILNTRMRIL